MKARSRSRPRFELRASALTSGTIDLFTAMPRAIKNFLDHRGLFLAAGLSFYLLAGLIPLILLFASIAGHLYAGETATAALIEQLTRLMPVYQNEVAKVVQRIVDARGGSGLAGAGILLVLGTQLFGGLRVVMDQVFTRGRARGMVHGLLWDFVMMALLSVLFLGNLAITAMFLWLKVTVFTPTNLPPVWIRLMVGTLEVSFLVALMYVIYRSFPARRVDHRAALKGALVGGLGWQAAKLLFRDYVLSVGTIDLVYGPVALFVAISVFAYWSGIVVIFGAEVANALEPKPNQ